MTSAPSDRYVVLGLANPRISWFGSVAQWANSSSIPVDFVKCVSPEELKARLECGRGFSAVLLDGTLAHVDRDLIDFATKKGCAAVVVDSRQRRPDWEAMGSSTVLASGFDREQLLETLRRHGRAIEAPDISWAVPERAPSPQEAVAVSRGLVVMVCGPGGTGSSTLATALAQGLARGHAAGCGDKGPQAGGRSRLRRRSPRRSSATDSPRDVLLADLCRNADQAMLHDAGDIGPGIDELVDAARVGSGRSLTPASLTFDVRERGYQLLLGLRRPSGWSAIRPRAFEVAFSTLIELYDVVVCDCDSDLEGERDGGSVDVEERNIMSRTVAGLADVAVAVGEHSMKGVHALARLVSGLVSFGVRPDTIVPVLNRAPRSALARSQAGEALEQLLDGVQGRSSRRIGSPIPIPARELEHCMRDGIPLPDAVSDPLVRAVTSVRARLGAVPIPAPHPARIRPGELGHWPDDLTEAGSPGEPAAFG